MNSLVELEGWVSLGSGVSEVSELVSELVSLVDSEVSEVISDEDEGDSLVVSGGGGTVVRCGWGAGVVGAGAGSGGGSGAGGGGGGASSVVCSEVVRLEVELVLLDGVLEVLLEVLLEEVGVASRSSSPPRVKAATPSPAASTAATDPTSTGRRLFPGVGPSLSGTPGKPKSPVASVSWETTSGSVSSSAAEAATAAGVVTVAAPAPTIGIAPARPGAISSSRLMASCMLPRRSGW